MLARMTAKLSRILLEERTHLVIQKRLKYKKKWAYTRPSKTPTQHALDYFDTYYKPIYGETWHSMRLALLSQQKYCVLINNFAEVEDTTVNLISEGADDFLVKARRKVIPEHKMKVILNVGKKRSASLAEHQTALLESIKYPDSTDPVMFDGDESTNIHSFVPVRRIVSASEQMRQEEIHQGFYDHWKDSEGFDVTVVSGGDVKFPYHLKAFTKERGDITMFESPTTTDSGKLNYYPLDGASMLPVLALDLHPDCNVLDLCAAPGGKTLAILQTILPGSVHCVDSSSSRLSRLKKTLAWYLPASYLQENSVQIIKACGEVFCRDAKKQYDRVLVDVPCYTDRHVLHQEDNNLFRPSRMSERLHIQNIQRDLLFAGIEACKPGGVVVYSTCTLSPPQNDGTVHAVLERIWQETNWQVVVEDLTAISHRFMDTFNFYLDCRFGQLVVPNLTANFGPMYFCKLRRIR